MTDTTWFGAREEGPQDQKYIGLTQDEAVKQAQESGLKVIRAIDFGGGTATMDRKSDRLTILVRDGIVVKAAIF